MSAADPKSATVSAALPLSDELRRWIDHVIVPILVEQYLREKGLKEERRDG
jgi:hypothetical protein